MMLLQNFDYNLKLKNKKYFSTKKLFFPIVTSAHQKVNKAYFNFN